MQLKVWVEVFTNQKRCQDFFAMPDEEWAGMGPEEREAHKADVFAHYWESAASGGCIEVESDS